jgi:hypothetical protein
LIKIVTTFLSRSLKYMAALLKMKNLPHPHPSPERRRACLPSPFGGGTEGGGALNLHLISIILLLTTPTTQAEGLGRLFFTPAQRAQLDHHNYKPTATVTNTDIATDSEETDSTVTVNGTVQRDGGKRTAWINGAARTVEQSDDNASVMVNLPDQNKTVRLKVGQRVVLSPPANTNAAKSSAEKPAPANDD